MAKLTLTAALVAAAARLVAAQEETLCDQYSTWSGDGYELQNNLWGESSATSGSQCTYLTSYSDNGVAWSTTWDWQGDDNGVKSYASVIRTITEGQLISDITSMPTTVSWAYNTTNGLNADVSYDLFTAAEADHDTYSGDYELMIWLDKIGSITPIGGTPTEENIDIGGQTWDLYYGTTGSQVTYSFVATSTLTSWSGDVKEFFTWLVDNEDFPQTTQYLLTYEFGTEAFTGGPTDFTVNNWEANVDS